MKKGSIEFLTGLLILLGCNSTDDTQPGVQDDENLSELYQVLQSDFLQPEDSLIGIRVSGGTEGGSNYFMDYYYNQAGQRILLVQKNGNADTVEFSIFKYDRIGNQKENNNFKKREGKTFWNYTIESIYNSNNQEIEVYRLKSNGSKTLSCQRFYNNNKQLEELRFGSEAFIYDYNQDGLISTEKLVLLNNPVQPLSELFYRYDALSRLQAKETNINADIPQRKDAFQYYYDKNGNLSEEREFETRFGYTLKERKEYIYKNY